MIRFAPSKRRTAGADVILPAGFDAELVGGEVTVELAPTGPDWCWVVIEPTKRGLIRYIIVPDVGDVVLEYSSLPDVDPATLEPSAEPEAAWWAAWQAMASGTYLVPDPSNPGLYLPTAGSAMVEDPAHNGLYTIGTLA
jgi:hypothetical protein